MARKKLIILASVCVLTIDVSYAQPSGVQQSRQSDTIRYREQRLSLLRSPIRELQADLDALLKNRDIASAHVGVCVLSLETGEYLYRNNEQKAFVPASIIKLFTTAAALELLGSNFRFTTRIYLDGRIRQGGEFEGNIIIRGSGDPTWSETFGSPPDSVFMSWIRALDSLGLVNIRGNIIADDNYFDAARYGVGWMWDDISLPYSPQISALAAYDNCVRLRIAPGLAVSEPARITVLRGNSYVRIINNVVTSTSELPVNLTPLRESNSNTIEIHGSIPLSKSSSGTDFVELDVPIDNPAGYVATLVREALEVRRIRVRGSAMTTSDWGESIPYARLSPLAEYSSFPLATVIAVMNKISHNLCAEMLLKTIGKESSGIGSAESGIDYVRQVLQRNGLPADHLVMKDGSGLSRLNLCTPELVVRLLWYLWHSKWRASILNSLARPGEFGTLRTRLLGTLAEKSVIAKTGSLDNISNLAGYVTTRDGEPLCFVVMVNQLLAPESIAKNIQDLICMRLASFSRH